MQYGLDYLGGCRYKDLILREHPAGWSAGFFANTFGNAWPTIEALLATGRCPEVRIHAIWDDGHQYRPQEHDKVIFAELKRANALKAKFPNVNVQFSPICEHGIKTNNGLADLFRRLQQAGQGLTFVNSVYQGDILPGVLNEVHGNHRKPNGAYNYSFDGLSAVDADIESIKQTYGDARTFYLWHPAFNGKLNTADKTPRPQRKAWPTSELIDSLIYLHRNCGAVKLPRNYLYKTHADRHNTPPSPREYKPVLITPVSAPRAELVADNGQVVAVLARSGKFTDGRPLYRATQYGYQIAEKLRRIQAGKTTCQLRLNGKAVGTINPAFRCGGFR